MAKHTVHETLVELDFRLNGEKFFLDMKYRWDGQSRNYKLEDSYCTLGGNLAEEMIRGIDKTFRALSHDVIHTYTRLLEDDEVSNYDV